MCLTQPSHLAGVFWDPKRHFQKPKYHEIGLYTLTFYDFTNQPYFYWFVKVFKLPWYKESDLFPKYVPENIQKQCACTWGILGPQWAGAYFFNVLLMHTLKRNSSKMPDITEYSSKLTEIWLIDKDIIGQSLKHNSNDILAYRRER